MPKGAGPFRKRDILVIAAIIAVGSVFGLAVEVLNSPVMPCREFVAMSRTCIPFGCTKTYINERGEDTGECR